MTVPYSISFTSLSLCAFVFTLGCTGVTPAVERVDVKDSAGVRKFEKHPFLPTWNDPNVNWERFKGIYVAPVNCDALKKRNWWNTVSFEQNREVAVKEVSQYMLHAIQKAVADAPTQKLSVVEKPGPEILVLDLALIELVPTKDWFHTSFSLRDQFVIHDSVAMEGRILEGGTGRVIGLFSNRQVGKLELVTMTDSDWSSHIHNIMDNWANQISVLLNSKKDENDHPFFKFYVESIGLAFADMLLKLSSVPRLGLYSQ